LPAVIVTSKSDLLNNKNLIKILLLFFEEDCVHPSVCLSFDSLEKKGIPSNTTLHREQSKLTRNANLKVNREVVKRRTKKIELRKPGTQQRIKYHIT
jgi:hypothetical protein